MEKENKIVELNPSNQARIVPNIHQKIIDIMAELDYIEKGDKTVNGQYRFVSHDQVTAKIHPLLVKHRVTAIPSTEDLIQDGNRTTVKLLLTFTNADCPSDCFTTRFIAHGIDGGGTTKDGREIPIGDKGPGKAISYAYKYAMLKTFCLETGDDPDNDANVAYEPEKCQEFDLKIVALLNEAEKKKLNKFLTECAASTNKHVEEVKREAMTRFDQFMEAFKKWSKK